MRSVNVADLEFGGPDVLGDRILAFFARKPPFYAVYSARRRVAVHFADEAVRADRQRRSLAPLAPLRGEIDGLIDGWRDGSTQSFFGLENRARLRTKADRYERRVADALVVALEGDVPEAEATLNAVKHDIINERTAWARFEYLIAAFVMALMVMFLAFLAAATYPFGTDEEMSRRTVWVAAILLLFATAAGATAFFAGNERRRRALRGDDPAPEDPGGDTLAADGRRINQHEQAHPPSPWITGGLLFLLLAIPIFALFVQPSFSHTADLKTFALPVNTLRAAAAGAVGAFFSIAIGIRSRTVLPDLLRTSNIMDAALRITIGFIAGAVLYALLRMGVVQVQLGGTSLQAAGQLGVVVVGFFAGFSERMVPDLLEKAKASPGGSAAITQKSASPPTPPRTAAGDAAGEADTDGEAEDEAGDAADPLPQQAGEDGCVADIDLDDDEITPDECLPAASGGVAQESEERP